VILGTLVNKGIPDDPDKLLAADRAGFVRHPVGMELLDGRGDRLARVGKERPLGDEVVEG
jgi:hypothetical protein